MLAAKKKDSDTNCCRHTEFTSLLTPFTPPPRTTSVLLVSKNHHNHHPATAHTTLTAGVKTWRTPRLPKSMPEKLPEAAPSRKRKQTPPSSMQELPTSSSSTSTPPFQQQPQQSTITDHFSPRGQGQSQSPANILPLPNSGLSSESTKKKKKIMRPVTEATMMNFGAQETPVDLTSPPPAASARRAPPPQATPLNSVKTPPKPTLQQSGAKRLQIKNFRASNENYTTGYTKTTWKSLDMALKAIYACEKIPMSREELYRGVENVCRAGGAHELHHQLLESCENYVSKELKPKIEKNVGDEDIEVARQLNANWIQWEKQLVVIILSYRSA